ncbi:molybdopterin-containing oxidoreductase family protein [Ktedonobacter racemifer]|uniref:Molybdopterin dinucleotide-binding region protein n=1 Tax=Ktedonobacter racemifer DSM 44963 TaxID=485913 RepID=D6TUJ5_KTERA|nr:molybdopterin-dependent oxidoreductase [Ktedonobacter racemifer]EFH84063.1 molybdopterin dinucleotide-binding region protein [Ktedonobacter racemifer DSM 44963]
MPARRQITTMCPMNCLPTQCGMTVEVEENKLVSLKGDVHNPDSRGFLCIRGRAAGEIFDNPKRLLHPLRRVGARGENRWEECSWDEAYNLIVENIQQTQPERVGLWRGHGVGTTGIASSMISRLGILAGYQNWNTGIVCWNMGGYGLGLTGTLETHTKEDMAANSRTILFWGSTLSSQPGTAPHLIEARKRGAYVVHIDTRRTEISRHADEVILLQPGSDAALALAMAHVILQEGLSDQAFIDQHTLGFTEFAAHVQQYTPEWAAEMTGIEPERIRQLARRYATATPAMIVLGGSSMYKHQHGWEASRAIACLPALTGQLGLAGGGLGPRHGASPRSDGNANVMQDIVARPNPAPIPSHMPTISAAFQDDKIDVLLVLGSNMLSTFADNNALARGLEQIKCIVSFDLFMNETARRYADLIIPGTAWLEDIGLKQTATHMYLMERALEPEGECRSLITVLRQLADRLELENFFPWANEEGYINALLAKQQTPSGKKLTVDDLRASGGYWQKSGLEHIAYLDHQYHTPSKKVEFWSERAQEVGLPPLPTYTAPQREAYPLRFCQGRTLTAFHAFFDEGQALPTLARVNPGPELWIHPQDAQAREIETGSLIVMNNERGSFEARAHITEDVLPGVVWMRDGWAGVNRLTSGAPVVPLAANDAVAGIPGGQATYDAWIEVHKVVGIKA